MTGVTGSLVSAYFAAEALGREFRGQLGEDRRDRARGVLRRWWRDHGSALGPVSTPRLVFDATVLLARALGFQPSSPRPSADARFLLAQLAPSRRDTSLPLLLVVGWAERLASSWRDAVRETLAAGAGWCLATNGRQLRLVDTRRSYAHRHLEFDLEAVFDDPPAFATFWAVTRRDAFLNAPGPRCAKNPLPLIELIVRASAERTQGVCRGLRAGVLDAVAELMDGLLPPRLHACPDQRTRTSSLLGLQEQSLTVVYRVLFWLFAESRGLVPTWHPTYRRSYSMEAVRGLAEGTGPARGLWETLQAMSRLAHAGCRAGTLQVTPFNGRLFAPSLTPAAESGRPGDDRARRMVLALTTAPGSKGSPRARIVYRDLGVEELGSVYEAVLDYRAVMAPRVDGGGRRRVELVAGSGLRKATGTFYTPSPITNFIVRRALWPLVHDAAPEEILGLRVLDPAMGSGAFLVAACRYLAGAYEEALLRAGQYHPGDIGDGERRSFRRLVAQQCLYGVDLNPMAVQLARLSLWLATLAPDRPLTFLDHRLLVGDSLVGASLDDVARRPFPGGRREREPRGDGLLPLFPAGEAGEALRAVLPGRLRLAATPDDSLGAVREKEDVLLAISGSRSPLADWKAVADAWCAIGFGLESGERPAAGLFTTLADHLLRGRCALPPHTADRWLDGVRATARARRFFHYTLEFPEVFFDAAGEPRGDAGFDAVLGNPPWDMIRDDSGQASAGQTPGETARLVRFARSSGLYRALSDGHRNRFQLFVERAIRLARRGGRLGLVAPSGLLSDSGCAGLRRLLFDRCDVDGVVGFDNVDRIFPIHRSQRFVVFTATAGTGGPVLRCRIGERDAAALDRIPDHGGSEHFPLVLTRPLLERLSGDDLAVPDVRHPADLALLEKLTASAAPLGAPEGWGAQFGRELNATDDRSLFWDGPAGAPVVAGKHLHPFRIRLPADVLRLRPGAVPRAAAVAAFGRSRLAYRDVSCATNRLTLIAAIVPPRHATVHTLFCLKTALAEADQWFLCGILNSLVANFLVRLRVATHVTTGIVSRLPVPRPPSGSRPARVVAALARALASSPDPEHDRRYVRLQAEASQIYGLTLEELRHVLASFPLIDARTKDGIEAAWRACRPGGAPPRMG